MTTSQITLHATTDCENERKDDHPDPHALRCNFARTHPSKPLFNVMIDFSNSLLMCIFTKNKNWRKNQDSR